MPPTRHLEADRKIPTPNLFPSLSSGQTLAPSTSGLRSPVASLIVSLQRKTTSVCALWERYRSIRVSHGTLRFRGWVKCWISTLLNDESLNPTTRALNSTFPRLIGRNSIHRQEIILLHINRHVNPIASQQLNQLLVSRIPIQRVCPYVAIGM